VASRTKKRRAPKKRAIQAPRRQAAPPARSRRSLAWVMVALLAAGAIVAAVIVKSSSNDDKTAAPAAGLPNTPDYHSLSVSPTDPNGILLGTHDGLYRSGDGGKTWSSQGLNGRDAMNLARTGVGTLWSAGHNVFVKSSDGGRTWVDVSPNGLPSLDLHGFAVDPRDPGRLYAAVAGQGLFRSDDGGRSFGPVSSEVGGAVMALAVTPSGAILTGDMQRGLLVSRDGGKSWRQTLNEGLMGLALNPSDPTRILAGGAGILLSTDGGRTWRQRLEIPGGAGPVAWAPSNPRIAYVVGFDRTLYRSSDGGETWSPVT
jgi:photosystem II stability/assembly factor-like uncharacterized protein